MLDQAEGMFGGLATPFEDVGPFLQASRRAVERRLAALRDKNIKRALDAELYFYAMLILRSGLRFRRLPLAASSRTPSVQQALGTAGVDRCVGGKSRRVDAIIREPPLGTAGVRKERPFRDGSANGTNRP
jgi:hypothetical protein